VAAALVAAVPANGEQDDEEDDNYSDADDDTPVHFVQSAVTPAPGLLVLPPGRRVPFGAAPSSI
jgi:hypothetical protein